jgi:hypothetical protein
MLSARSLDAQVPNFYRRPVAAYSPLVRAAFRALLSGPAFFFNPQVDGGGSDGGSSDGSNSDGTGASADGGDAAAAAAAPDAHGACRPLCTREFIVSVRSSPAAPSKRSCDRLQWTLAHRQLLRSRMP